MFVVSHAVTQEVIFCVHVYVKCTCLIFVRMAFNILYRHAWSVTGIIKDGYCFSVSGSLYLWINKLNLIL